MKKHLAFLSGIVCTLAIVALTVTSFAAGGEISYNKVNVSLFGSNVIKAGQDITADNGLTSPSSITYTDTQGGGTIYLPIRQISKLLDADITWDNTSGTVALAPVASSNSVTVDKDGSIHIVDNISGTDEANRKTAPFAEVNAQAPASGVKSYPLLSEFKFQSESDFDTTLDCMPTNGKTITVTLTNNDTSSSAQSLIFNLGRDNTIGDDILFPSVTVAPGKTLSRTVTVDSSATQLTRQLRVDVTYSGGAPYTMNATVSAVQF